MATKDSGGGDNATKEIGIFGGILIILFIGWLITGGREQWENVRGKFIKPAPPVGTGEVYDKKFFPLFPR